MKTPSTEEAPLKERAIAGVFWTVAQKWVTRVTAVLTLAVLARALSPTDFGIVAVALAVLPLTYVIADMGFGTYIVQAPHLDKRTLSTAFWYSCGAGSVLALGLWVAAPLIATMLGASTAGPVIAALAPVVLIVSIGSVPAALLRRRMQFRKLALQSLVAALGSQLVAVSAIALGLGVWALVAQTLTFQIIATAIAWISTRWWPGLLFSWSEFREMAAFGGNVVGTELIAQGRAWVEAVVIASTLGVTALGYYSIAQRLVQVAQDSTAAAVLPVATVFFSKLRGSAAIGVGYLRALGLTYALIVPVMVFVSVGAGDLIPLLFGDGWRVSIPIAQILAVAGILTMGAMLDHGLFYGMGAPGRWLRYALVVDVLTLTGTVVAVHYGLVVVAYAFAVIALIATLLRTFIVGRLLSMPVRTVIVPFLRVLVCGAVSMATAVTTGLLLDTLPSLIRLPLLLLVIVVVHALLCRWLMPGEYKEVRRLVMSVIGKLRVWGKKA